MALEDFAAYRINFRNKADNLAEILRELNLQPGNAVMIDDNPAERAAVQAVLISAESARRTGMMHAQLRRDSVRRELSQEEFLQSLNLRASIARVPSTSDLHMSRALELFNKTNQFNTTGERYTLEHCHRRFAAGYATASIIW
jgi:predicted enzyme involved in methoxymalonyl-ACP biosynthesis